MTISALVNRELNTNPMGDLSTACSYLKHTSDYNWRLIFGDPPPSSKEVNTSYSPQKRKEIIAELAQKHIPDIYLTVCENDPLRLLNLSQPVVTQRSADNTMLLKEREQYAKLILDPYERKNAIVNIIEKYLDYELVLEATRVAGNCSDINNEDLQRFIIKYSTKYFKSHELKDLIVLLSKLEMETDKIPNVKIKNRLLANIAGLYAKDNCLSKAEEIAYSITDDENKTLALIEICEMSSKKGFWRKAEEIAGSIADISVKESVFYQISQACVETYAVSKTENLSNAERIADKISDKHLQDKILYKTVNAYLEENDLSNAERIADKISDKHLQDIILSKTADYYLEENDLSNAERVALKIQNPQIMNPILHTISIDYINSPNDACNLSQAERVASFITITFIKETALYEIALAYINSLELPQAERVANTITNITIKEELLILIAMAYIKYKPLTEAVRLANIISNMNTGSSSSSANHILFITNLQKHLDKLYILSNLLYMFSGKQLLDKIYQLLQGAE